MKTLLFTIVLTGVFLFATEPFLIDDLEGADFWRSFHAHAADNKERTNTVLKTNSYMESATAKLTTQTVTNVATVKRSSMFYGCLVGGCTADHSTTWWERSTVVQKIIYAEIKGQQFELSRGDVSRTVTNFIPRVTDEGMMFEISTNGLGAGTQYGN